MGKSDFRLLSKNYKETEYTRWRDVNLSVIDPLDSFPRPSDNHTPVVEDSHAKVIAEAVKKAKEAAEKRSTSEWTTVGKRPLSPEQVERNIRKKLNSPIKINAALQRIINGEKILDLGDLGVEDEQEEVVADLSTVSEVTVQQPAVPIPEHIVPSAPPTEEEVVSEVEDSEVMIEEPNKDQLDTVNLGTSKLSSN